MRSLTEKEYRVEAKAAFSKVFQSNDPSSVPFSPVIECRTLLYPVHYKLEPLELNAISLAAKAVGDESFYLSVLERPPENEQDRSYHWLISFAEMNEYYSLGYPFVLENAAYSISGKWGIMMSQEAFAVVGGSNIFLKMLCDNLQIPCEKQVKDFLKDSVGEHERWEADIDWIHPLIIHLYGEGKGEKLLREHFLRLGEL